MACEAVPSGAGFISATTNALDCQAQILGSGAWQALAVPGSTLSVVLTGFLILFIALIGYNLLLGWVFTVRTGTLAFVKIGAVLALATSWPAYRTLVYDLVVDGPQQLVAEIGPSARIVGADGTLLQRLDLADRTLAELAILGPGNFTPLQADQVPPPFAGFNAFALGGARIAFLLTVIAGLATVRLVAGLMLALGPFFIAFLLFDSTLGLFEGWVRVLAGTALAAIGVPVMLGLELALLEPWLASVLARRLAGEALPTLPTELFVVSSLFVILVLAAFVACVRVARAFRLPPVLHLQAGSEASRPAAWPRTAEGVERSRLPDPERSRAAAIASGLVSSTRRDHRFADAGSGSGALPANRALAPTVSSGQSPRVAQPVGRSFSRRASARSSARASRRDATQ